MVGLILLVACSNIASLLLSRAVARRREMAVRLGISPSSLRLLVIRPPSPLSTPARRAGVAANGRACR
jgi:hypothetical protein